ncbi:hypothetical protein GCM10027317_42110 [Massilia agri]
MKIPDSFEEFEEQCKGYRGWHGRMPRLPTPPAPEPGLGFLDRLRWHLREYWCPKSKEERLLIKLAKKRWD